MMAVPATDRPADPRVEVKALKAVRLGLRLIGTVSDLPAGQKVRDEIIRDLRRIVDDAIASVEAGL